MLFNSAIFLFIFLPVLLSLYYWDVIRYKNILLLVFSIAFYAWGEQEIVLIMLASTVLDYGNGILIDKGYRRTGLIASIIVNLGYF